MKVLVVLVLAVLTGCNANLLYADAPKSKLDELTDAFHDSVDTLTKSAGDFLNRLQETKFGQDLSARLEEGVDVFATNIKRVKKTWGDTPKEVQRYVGGLSFGIYGLAIRVEEKKTTIKKHLEPVVERLAPVTERIFSVLTQRTQHVRNLAFPYVNTMMEKVDSWSQALPARLDTLYDSYYNSN